MIKKYLTNIWKKFESFIVPKEDDIIEISPEREEIIIETIVKLVGKYEMETPALFFLSPLQGMSTMVSQLWVLQYAPYLETLGIPGYELSAFFYKKENAIRLLERIRENRSKRYDG